MMMHFAGKSFLLLMVMPQDKRRRYEHLMMTKSLSLKPLLQLPAMEWTPMSFVKAGEMKQSETSSPGAFHFSNLLSNRSSIITTPLLRKVVLQRSIRLPPLSAKLKMPHCALNTFVH
jgi:hypothetical protein